MRPFLKWLGNKYKLIEKIQPHLSNNQRLIEPFAGSCALFLNSNFSNYLLGEQNQDLINLYQQLTLEGQKFISYAKRYFNDKYNNEEKYYLLREQFNTTNNQRLKAALFLYLNRHGYNGLCRYNSKGVFNVPFGRYVRPYFPEKEMQYFHEKAQTAQFYGADFKETMSLAETDDIVYCDPPYVALSDSADFTNYTHKSFLNDDQINLATTAQALANKNITVIISNHDTPESRSLYKHAEIHSFPVSRTISANTSTRKPVNEILAIYR